MKPLRYVASLPALIALPSLVQSVLPVHLPDDVLMSSSTAFGLIVASVLWSLYFWNVRYVGVLLQIEGALSLPTTVLIILSYFYKFNFPLGNLFFKPSAAEPFMLNLAITFTTLYLIQIIYRWLARAVAVINGLLAVMLFIAVLSISGHVYMLDRLVTTQWLMPIPPVAIIGFMVLGLAIFIHANHIERLYLNKKIIFSFVMMFIAILGANVVVYKNFSKTVTVTAQVNTTRQALSAIYDLDSQLDSAEAASLAYSRTGEAMYLTSYATSKQNYGGVLQRVRQDAQATGNGDIIEAVNQIGDLGQQVFVSADGLIASRKQGNLSAAGRVSITQQLNDYTEVLLDRIKDAGEVYTGQLSQLVVQEAYGNRGVVTGVSISSALSVLLLIFTPLFIRQTIRKLSLTQDKLKKSYRQLAEEKSRAEAILTNMGDGIFAVDRSAEIVVFNPAAERITGFAATNMLGKPFDAVLRFTPDNGDKKLLHFVAQALDGKVAEVSHNLSLTRSDGRKIEVQLTATPVKDRKGKVRTAIVVFRDRTEEQALENAKDEFLALASHQLRTPATATKQFLAMFLEGYAGTITAKQRVFLQEAYDNNELGINIIEELLNIARLESNQIKIKKQQLDAAELVRRIVENHAATAKKNKQTIHLEVPDGPVPIVADASMLSMVLDNLISNALKYTLEGGAVTIAVKRTATRTRIAVSDTGIGIKKTDLPRIFHRFSRLEDPSKQHVSGTGIGLYLVQKIMDMHHGKIKVESVYGEGSTFTAEFNDQE